MHRQFGVMLKMRTWQQDEDKKRNISYLSSCSSLSSLVGVSFKPPFLARGHPDKLKMVGDSLAARIRQQEQDF